MAARKRFFAWLFRKFISDHGQSDLTDPLTRDIRAPLLARARGDVLEIGAGDGSNVPLYPPGVRLTLLEPNRYLLKHIPGVARRVNVSTYRLVESFGECLPFPAGCFDTVVSTHVLCSVHSQARVLAEVRRVLRPGGVFLFLEHVTAPPHTPAFRTQRLINPVWRRLGDGCYLTRDTGAAIQRAGFRDVVFEHIQAGYPSFVSLHVVGSAEA
ncbi:MAG: methyltransferase domain-containing protein [Anaerolineae bacterium]|nr:methyltransferase domain-containing protein [Anaerolineae bacterium]